MKIQYPTNGAFTVVETPLHGDPDNGVDPHLIGAFIGRPAGPTLIVVGSLHGNEPAGAAALSDLVPELEELADRLKGRVYFITGNTRALADNRRFVDVDLNRSWTPRAMSAAASGALGSEGAELHELDRLLDSILITAMDEVFVLDLHSTSSDGTPFATVGDTLRNREFALKFPVTVLLGIEEQLDGTLLEYLNNAGAVTLGFEGGQHVAESTLENHKAMVWLAAVNAGILEAGLVPHPAGQTLRLTGGSRRGRIFEIRYRHAITSEDEFEMRPGFSHFDAVRRDQVLAYDRRGVVTAVESGRILMPLYQKQGEDGFFIGREISPFWLWLSGALRRMGLQKMMHLLPGVSRDPDDAGTLIINTSVARLFPLQVFHLLGYRRRRWLNNKLIVSRRRHDTDGPFIWKGK